VTGNGEGYQSKRIRRKKKNNQNSKQMPVRNKEHQDIRICERKMEAPQKKAANFQKP